MSSAVRRPVAVPGHAQGTLQVGPMIRLWCSCGGFSLEINAPTHDEAHRLARQHWATHIAEVHPDGTQR